VHAKEVHHRVPRHLLRAYDRMAAHTEFDGEGIEMALEFEELAMRHGLGDTSLLTRAELAGKIERSRVELAREEHREAHAADWREWGSWGGNTTLARYGRRYFSYLSRRRWGQITPEELERVRERLRLAPHAAASRASRRRGRRRWRQGSSTTTAKGCAGWGTGCATTRPCSCPT
jgi:hypothetical protein